MKISITMNTLSTESNEWNNTSRKFIGYYNNNNFFASDISQCDI
jgi:hypothetical protein